MNDPDITRTARSHPPISSSTGQLAQDTLLQRGAFDPPATPGTLGRLDRFEILRLLGEGGMGQVYLAREPLTDTQVAIKVMKPQSADDPREVHRFLTEARHMYRLAHPRILRVLEVSDRPAGPYYVMPYIAGGSLLGRCKPEDPMPEAETLAIARQVAEALAHAHSHGLIHRDLKPGNVLLDKEGNAYLTDFGLVRTIMNDSMVDASASHLEGTAPYMSPAVARGEAEDTRCDIYAFGALLYELLTGQPPYTGRTPQIILDQVLKGPPCPLLSRNPKANPALVKIAEGCMARELRDRYASMADVVADLDRAAGGEAPLGQHPRGRSHPARLTTLAAAALAIVVLAGLAVWHFGASTPGTPSSVARVPSPASDVTLSPPDVQRPESGVLGAVMEIDRSPFIFTTNNGAITVTEYTGPGGDVVIPDSIGGLPVTGIGCKLFSNKKMQKIGISSSITHMEPLTSSHSHSAVVAFHIDPDNPVFKSDGNGVWYSKNGDTLIAYPPGRRGEYEIPDHVTTIGPNAFHGAMISRLVIPGSVRKIDSSAFTYCRLLTEVNIPASVELIQANPFSNCDKLSAIHVDERNPFYFCREGVLFDKTGVHLIAYFAGKAGSFTIPEGVRVIKHAAFRGCYGLVEITVPSGVNRIENFVFGECYNLSAIRFEGDAPQLGQAASFDQGTWPTVYYRPGKKGWGPTFCGRPTAVWEDAPAAAVTTSQPTAHSPQSKASSSQPSDPLPPFPSNDNKNFTYETNNGTITVTKYIGPGGDVVIPDSIGGLPVTGIGSNAFAYRPITTVSLPESVSVIGDNAFTECKKLTMIVLPDRLSHIGKSAFKGCEGLTDITIPAGVAVIESGAFRRCISLTNVVLSAGVQRIEIESFSGCRNLRRVIMHDGLVSIGNMAFKDCTGLASIIIPDSVVSIAGTAFKNCTNLSAIDLPKRLEVISHEIFAGCTRLARVAIPAGVIRIDSRAFAECTNLEEVVFPDGLLTIGDLAFANCFRLVRADFPLSLTNIGNGAFRNCASLTSVQISERIMEIKSETFVGCSNLGRVTVPNRIYSIGARAFADCQRLRELIFEGSAPRLDQGVFDGAEQVTVYYRPGTRGWAETFGGRPTVVWEGQEQGPSATGGVGR